MNTIGKRLKFLRDVKGITQEALAEAITENRASIANWENDRSDPPAATIVTLANYYQVTTDFILGRNTEVVEEEGFCYGLNDEEKTRLKEQAEFYRYRKQIPGDSGGGSAGLTIIGTDTKNPKRKKAK